MKAIVAAVSFADEHGWHVMTPLRIAKNREKRRHGARVSITNGQNREGFVTASSRGKAPGPATSEGQGQGAFSECSVFLLRSLGEHRTSGLVGNLSFRVDR